ncbi:antigen b membrane protein [Plakobranchus ocellatus]|uniref:Antigen b membrane protein n=1 Tax=Plakobranchus ocellatus TaxID=259542 RepID=A0AAV3ZUK5_9GAST|nr:antigen b membrane protein [Plakobranchus ocellatus]
MYKGQTVIDGLPVDRWQSCITWDDVGATFTLDYYFTTNSFKPRDLLTPKQIPVRAEVMGIVKKGNAKARQIHHIYEYLDFRVFDRLNWDTFSLPDFMICSGEMSVWNRGFPIPPDSMSYTVEKVVSALSDPNDKDARVDLSTVYYDAGRRLVRVDKEAITTITDFSNGLEYGIDPSGCTIRAIDPAHVSWAVKEDGVIKMVDMNEIALMRNIFYFTGYKLFRGVLTLAFAGTEKGYQLEAYLSLDGNTPLGLRVKSLSTDSLTTYNIFNFLASSQRSKENSFDVSKCVKSDNTINKIITWIPQRLFYNSIESLDIEDLRLKVAEFVGISSLQIVTEDYAFDTVEGTFHWFVSFLGFDSQQSQAKVENQLPIKPVSEIDQTVQIAVEGGTLQCTVSLGLYGSTLMIATNINSMRTLRLSIESDIEYSYGVTNDECVKKFEEKETFVSAENEHNCAQVCADLKVIPCTMFQYTKSTQACQMSWMEKRPELVPTPGCNFHAHMYRLSFIRYPGQVLMARSDSAYREASDEETCAKQCMEEKNFFCESYDYCETEQRCQIYDTHFFSDEAAPQKSDDSVKCSHYSRSYSSNFKYTFGRDFNSAEAIDVSVDWYGNCPYMCSTLEGGCAAFSDCRGKGREKRCKILPATKAETAVFDIYKSSCVTGIPRGNVGLGKIALSAVQSIQTGSDKGSRYTGAEMFGLSVAMSLVGVLCAILTVFLLRHFNIWEGF